MIFVILPLFQVSKELHPALIVYGDMVYAPPEAIFDRTSPCGAFCVPSLFTDPLSRLYPDNSSLMILCRVSTRRVKEG